MADIESNVKVNIDTSDALAQLKLLQQQISAFQQAMRKAGADNALAARQMQQNLANSINATGKFQANIQTIQTSAERFTGALEKNKLTMGEYFRYAGGASKTFGKLFKSEFDTINNVARERVKDLQTQYIKLGRDANGAMKAIAVKPLALDMDNLGTKTQIAAQRQQLFNQLMKQGSTNLLNFGKNTQWAGRQLMVGFTIPLTLMGSAAAKAYMEIEKASIAFKRVYGDINTTADETEKMVKNVRALATEFTKYGVAVSDTMDMAAKAAAMGKTGADLLAQISQASKLSVLGQVDQQQALDTTISLTNAFGIATEDLSGKIDFLNAVENQTVTSIEDLTIAIPKAAPVIQQLGGNVEDLTFFLTAMREGGINASEGANALKSGLASLINPSKKASDFMASFGISIKGIVEGNKGDVKGTVIDMAKALDTLDPLNRARAIEQMFGKFQFSRISTLFKNVIDEGSQANKVAGLAKETAEELAILSERELKKVSDSPMYKFQKSIEDVKAKLAPVGEAFLKAVTPVIEFVTKILDGFNGLSDGAKQFASIATLAIAGIGPILLMTFGLIANGAANIMKLFVNIKSFFNKTGNKTDILGEQTRYMNTEQLRSAAIAASLDQSHGKLRQTFTAEAAAVDALTQAYKRAVQAQGAYSGVPGVPVGAAGAKPKKYANGVSMVPGPKGAGDIVPALLSPGEAVIPAKYASKYAPVIAGMVSGNLPAYANGTTGAGMSQSYDYNSMPVPKYGRGGYYMAPASTYKSPAKIAYEAEQKRLAEERANSPEGKARAAAQKAKNKKSMPQTFLYDPKVAGPLTEDSPVVQRMLQDQGRGKIMFVTDSNALAFTASAEYRMLRKLGLGASSDRWGVVSPFKTKGLGDFNNVNVYGSRGGIVRRYNQGTENVKPESEYTTKEIYKLLPMHDTHAFGEMSMTDPATAAQAMAPFPDSKLEDFKNFKVLSNLTMTLPAKLNQGIKDPDPKTKRKGLPGTLFSSIYNAFNGKLSKTAKMAGVKNLGSAQALEDLIGTKFAAHPVIDDSLFAKIVEETINDQTASNTGLSGVANLIWERSKQVGTVRPKRDMLDQPKWDSLIRDMLFREELVLKTFDNAFPVADTPFGGRFGRVNSDGIGTSKTAEGRAYRKKAYDLINQWAKAKNFKAPLPLIVDNKGNTRPMTWRDNAAKPGTYNTKDFLAYDAKSPKFASELGLNPGALAILRGAGYLKVDPLKLAKGTTNVSQSAIAAFGAHQPFTSAHESIARMGMDLANKQGVPFRQFSTMQGKTKRSILSDKLKSKLIKESIGITPSLTQNPFTLMETLSAEGIKKLTLLLGEDRMNAQVFDLAAEKYGITLKKVGIPRDPNGVSGTATRLAAGNGNWEAFFKLVAPTASQATKAEVFKQLQRGMSTKKYANGVFSVPGPKGAGDVVPAMLTPGEAVIPADRAEQHRGLITQMIAGKLPGYNKGTSGVPGYNQGIPGVPTPPPYVAPESPKGFQGIVASLSDSAKKVADAALATTKVAAAAAGSAAKKVGGKALDVAEAGLYQATKGFLNPNNDLTTGRGGRVLNQAEVDAIDAEKKAIEKQNRQRADAARKELEANDAEYQASQKRVQQLQEKIESGKKLTKAEEEDLAKQKQLLIDKRALVRDEIKQRQTEDGTLIQRSAQKGTPEYKQQQQDKKDARNAQIQNVAGKLSQVGMTASMAAGALSMIPGPVGQVAQGALPLIAGFSTMAGFIQGPISAVVVGLVAIAGSMYLAVTDLNNKFKESAAAAQANKEAMGGSTQAIRKLSEFTKKVTAGELGDRTRANKMVGINTATGKTTFGESYVKSEQGAEFIKNFKEQIKVSGGITKNLTADYANQLVMAVTSGALTKDQAASIAANVGAALGDANFAFSVRAQVGEILGPNGQDLQKDPIEIAAVLKTRSLNMIKADRENLQKTMNKDKLFTGMDNTEGNRTGTVIGSGVVGGVAGGVAGLGVAAGATAAAAGLTTLAASGGAAAAAMTATAAGLTAVATFAAPVLLVAGAVAAVYFAYNSMVDAQKRAGAAAGAMIADMNMALQQQKEMADVLAKYYDKKVAEAKAEGDITEQKRLQLEYDEKKNKLAEINKELVKGMETQYNASDEKTREALRTGAENAVAAKYKDNPDQLLFMDLVKQQLTDSMSQGLLKGDDKMTLQMQMLSGNILPGDMTKLLSLMTDQDMTTKVMKVVTDFGATTAQQMAQTLAMFTDENVKKEIALEVSGAATNADALKILDLAQKVGQLGGVISADVIVNYFNNNDQVAKDTQAFLAAFEASGGKLNAQVAMKIDNKIVGGENFDVNYFDKLKTKDQNQYLQVIESIIQVDAPVIQATDDYKRWLNDEGAKLQVPPGGGSVAWWVGQYAMQRAFKVTSETPASALDVGGPVKPKDQGSGPSASFLDPYVESLRNASNWQQKLTVGFAASLKALRGQEGALTKFAGLALRLKTYGADTNFIQAVLGGDPKDIDKVIDRATGKLTKAGEDAIRIAKKVENAKIGMAYVITDDSGRREKDNELYNAGLEVIAGKEKKINDKYDARIKALDEIGKIQERNNQQQQDSMSLADALSKGDIAAAAKAALQAKQNDQKAALDSAKASIDNARKNELDAIEVKILGKTERRSTLEQKIADNSAAIAKSKLDQLNREVEIGKKALITAKATAETLANGRKIAGLKSTIGGGVPGTTPTGTPVTPTVTPIKATSASTVAANLKGVKSIANVATLQNAGSGLLSKVTSKTSAEDEKQRLTTNALVAQRTLNNFRSSNKKGKTFNYSDLSPAQKTEHDRLEGVLTTANQDVKNFSAEAYKTKTVQNLENFIPKEILAAFAKLKELREGGSRPTLVSQIAQFKTDLKAIEDKNGGSKDPSTYSNNDRTKALKIKQELNAANTKGAVYKLNKYDIDSGAKGIEDSIAAKGYGQFRKFFAGYAKGGMVYANNGLSVEASKYALGTDTIPAMLTPGEFVMSKPAVDRIGSKELSSMNNGTSIGESVYNYSITVNANSSDSSGIADAVLREIQRIDSRRIRSSAI